MKKVRKQREPSRASLREMPEVDFSTGKVGRNRLAARIAAEGMILPGRGRPKKGMEIGTAAKSVRLPPHVWASVEKRAKANGLTLHAALRTAIIDWVSRGS